jgi:hypothetical protein
LEENLEERELEITKLMRRRVGGGEIALKDAEAHNATPEEES